MNIYFINLDISDKVVEKEIKTKVIEVISRKEFILGKEVKEFEEKFAEYIGCSYAVGVSSGSAALLLSLKSLDIKDGDYVITTPFTFTATAEVILHCNAKIIFADIDEKTYNISSQEIEECVKKFGQKIKAVIPVHLYGQPCDMEKIVEICKKHNIKIIEDAAQAHGAEVEFRISRKLQDSEFRVNKVADTSNSVVKRSEFQRQKVGSIGDLGCFSFYPTKNLGCYGDGGLVTTDDKNLYEKLLRLRNHGRVEHYLYKHIGFNARLDNLQAAILLIKLKYLDKWNKERQKIAEIYNKELAGVGDIVTPYVQPNVSHVYHLYVIRTKYRDKLMEFLKNNGIGCTIQYAVPLNLQPAYKRKYEKVSELKTVRKVANEVLSLPIYPGLKESQVEYVVNKIKQFFKNI
jgi:dTDP-4-amino-4,6-dideoxygalactose transaminase